MHCTALDTQNTVCFADYHRKEQLTLADSASLPELDLLPLLFDKSNCTAKHGFEVRRITRQDTALRAAAETPPAQTLRRARFRAQQILKSGTTNASKISKSDSSP
ncbi:conserved hypothetical protein [Trichinella spiralis]|uniref:hypothetical protein n=1 Tax=Trichinella spiralis TaxID=6334 RepID=UPI0001EFB7A9|nr:conserved hypothetical protein [Trichinella spiralis]